MTRQLRFLLLQAHHADDPARADERRSFALRSGLELAQIVPWDLLVAAPTLADVRRYDALLIGGSGDFYVSKGDLPGQPIWATRFHPELTRE